tara:strand:- start:243 stop:929 length:687 start_codon:yes stop_codon:yes gene_type:complete
MGTVIKPPATTKRLLRKQKEVADKVLKEELRQDRERRMKKAGGGSARRDLQDAREKFFEGPASDSQSFYQFLKNQGRPDLVKLDKTDRTKKSTGGRVKMAKGSDKKVKMPTPDEAFTDHMNALKKLQEAIRKAESKFNIGRTKKAGGGELKGNQKKLDKNNDGEITGQDFKLLRANKSYGGRVKLSKGTPNPALMNATNNRATNGTNGKMSRGGGASGTRGNKFKGVF